MTSKHVGAVHIQPDREASMHIVKLGKIPTRMNKEGDNGHETEVARKKSGQHVVRQVKYKAA